MLKARSAFLKTFKNLTVTSTIFTSLGSQKAAKKAGYEENSTVELEKVQKVFPSMIFSDNDVKECKIYSFKIWMNWTLFLLNIN